MAGQNNRDNDINLRQKEILRLVVDGYIQRARPVSSFYIARNYNPALSSATIRSIFSDLESKGYLYSPHRSAGRIPTARGYRLYVEQLPEKLAIPEADMKFIQKEYLKRDFQLYDILDVTSKILSMMTNYAGFVVGPEPEQAVLKHIELIDMGQDEVLVVMVTRSGAVYSKILYLEKRIPRDYLHKISQYLNDTFKGCDLRDIRNRLDSDQAGDEDILQYFSMIARTISANFDSVKGEEQFFTSGLDNLYALISRGKSERIRELGYFFESSEQLRRIFKKTLNLDDVFVLIDDEDNNSNDYEKDDRLNDISIVSGSYRMGEKRIGAIGVVGPNRMDYNRVISIVEYVRCLISNMITRMSN